MSVNYGLCRVLLAHNTIRSQQRSYNTLRAAINEFKNKYQSHRNYSYVPPSQNTFSKICCSILCFGLFVPLITWPS